MEDGNGGLGENTKLIDLLNKKIIPEELMEMELEKVELHKKLNESLKYDYGKMINEHLTMANGNTDVRDFLKSIFGNNKIPENCAIYDSNENRCPALIKIGNLMIIGRSGGEGFTSMQMYNIKQNKVIEQNLIAGSSKSNNIAGFTDLFNFDGGATLARHRRLNSDPDKKLFLESIKEQILQTYDSKAPAKFTQTQEKLLAELSEMEKSLSSIVKTFPVRENGRGVFSSNYLTAKNSCIESFEKQRKRIIQSDSSYEKIKHQIETRSNFEKNKTVMINNFVSLASLAKNDIAKEGYDELATKAHYRNLFGNSLSDAMINTLSLAESEAIRDRNKLATKHENLINNAVKGLEKRNLLGKSLDKINGSSANTSGALKLAIINKIVEKSTLPENLKVEMIKNPDDIAMQTIFIIDNARMDKVAGKIDDFEYSEIIKNSNSIARLKHDNKLGSVLEKIIKIKKENSNTIISNSFKDRVLEGIISNNENKDANGYSLEAKMLLLQKLNLQNETPVNEKLFVNLRKDIRSKLSEDVASKPSEEGFFKILRATIKTEEARSVFFDKLFTEFKEKEPNGKIIDNIYGNNGLYRNNHCIKIRLPKIDHQHHQKRLVDSLSIAKQNNNAITT